MSYSDAVAAKMARACDACLRRRARCFCEADDAFLCQACDVSVHSANPLSRRHHRIRLKTASSSPSSSPSPSFSPPANDASDDSISTPAWLHGFKRKPRTPRGKPGLAGTLPAAKVEPLVPDLEDLYPEENQPNDEEQLLYCVPILDPVLAEFCSPASLDDANASGDEVKPAVLLPAYEHVSAVAEVDGLAGFRPSDLDLAEFASDMETLLGRGLDDDSFCIDGLGLVDEAVGNDSKGQVKVEMEVDAACNFRMEIALSKETLDIDFDCRTPTMEVEVEKQKPLQEAAMASDNHGVEAAAKRRMTLRLDYEDVIAAWSSNGCSPWTDGERPQFDPNDTWPDFPAVARGGGEVQAVYQQLGHVVHTVVVDEGREARVSRYREKRRTRLFSKKIRYEVRKLNAEKRPRMKGRFVKRSSAFPAAGTAAAVSALPRR